MTKSKTYLMERHSKFRPFHPEEVSRDWHWLSPRSLGLVQSMNFQHIANQLGLSPTGKARMVQLLTGGSLVLDESGNKCVSFGPGLAKHQIPEKEWKMIKLLFNSKDVENL